MFFCNNVFCVFARRWSRSVASGRADSGRIGRGRAVIRGHGHAVCGVAQAVSSTLLSVKSCPAKTCRFVEAEAATEGSAGLLPCQPGRHMYGAVAEPQLCLSRSFWRRACAHEGDVLAVDDVLDEPA